MGVCLEIYQEEKNYWNYLNNKIDKINNSFIKKI